MYIFECLTIKKFFIHILNLTIESWYINPYYFTWILFYTISFLHELWCNHVFEPFKSFFIIRKL